MKMAGRPKPRDLLRGKTAVITAAVGSNASQSQRVCPRCGQHQATYWLVTFVITDSARQPTTSQTKLDAQAADQWTWKGAHRM